MAGWSITFRLLSHFGHFQRSVQPLISYSQQFHNSAAYIRFCHSEWVRRSCEFYSAGWQTQNQTIQLTYINALGLCLNFAFQPCTDQNIKNIQGIYEQSNWFAMETAFSHVHPKSWHFQDWGWACYWSPSLNSVTISTSKTFCPSIITRLVLLVHFCLKWIATTTDLLSWVNISTDWNNVFLASLGDFQYSWSDSSNTLGRRGLGACCRLVRSPLNYSPTVECIQEL